MSDNIEDKKQRRLYEVLRAGIDLYVEIEGKLMGKREIFVGTVSTTILTGDTFTAELRFKSSDNEEPDAIYKSTTGKLHNNTVKKGAPILDTIDCVTVVF